MAHQLAEAICELAAPPLQPSFIRVQAWVTGDPMQCLVLHVRPRPLAAGLEVAVYSGQAEDDEAQHVRLGPQAALFAAPATPGGVADLAADLLAAGPQEVEDYSGVTLRFHLADFHPSPSPPWALARVDLWAPSQVAALALPNGHLRLSFPTEDHCLGGAEVVNRSMSYANRQRELKAEVMREEEEQERQQAAGGGATPSPTTNRPDDPQVFAQRFRQLRDDAMTGLREALAAMLRHALRFRGLITHPAMAAQAPPAAAAPQPEVAP